jgi:DNA-directed RNA polymerase subunit RPC12/RpoP
MSAVEGFDDDLTVEYEVTDDKRCPMCGEFVDDFEGVDSADCPSCGSHLLLFPSEDEDRR